MKEVGTLEEIGAKVGDVVDFGQGRITLEGKTVAGWFGRHESNQPRGPLGDCVPWRMIRRAAATDKPGPVRMKPEIVPGVYGMVGVETIDDGRVAITIDDHVFDADELTAAIDTLTQIRDAMKEDAK